MRALLHKELRELAWLGIPLAVLWSLAWWLAMPVRGLLGPSGQRMELIGPAAIVLGTLLGFIPFELERRTGMRTFLAHRGLRVRTIAWTRLAASSIWTVGILGLGLVGVFALHLAPSLAVPGYASRALGALVLAELTALPALAVGALVGSLEARGWMRWLALLVAGVGLADLAGTMSRWEVVRSPVGVGPFVTLCVLISAGASWMAVEHFAGSMCEDRRVHGGARLGSGILALVVTTPLFLQFVSSLQFTARGLAWSSNAFWLRTEEGQVEQRAPWVDPPEPPSQWLTFRPADTIRLGASEQLLFHPVGGTSIWRERTLGQGSSPFSNPLSWAIGVRVVYARETITDGEWVTWSDPQLERVVSRWWPLFGVPAFASFALPSATGSQGDHHLESIRIFPYGQRAFTVTDGLGFPVAILANPPPTSSFRSLPRPDIAGPLECVDAHEVVCVDGPAVPPRQEFSVFVGEAGAFAFDGEALLPLASFREGHMTQDVERPGVRVVLSAYDGLSYDFTLFDADSGATLAAGRVAPVTSGERLSAFAAQAATLARAPISTLIALLGFPRDGDGSATPAKSAWIDPLVLGGRRPWLVALNQALAIVLAWLARRRLGGRSWGWPLAIVALGGAAWLVCLVLEPRRAAARASSAPQSVPGWAPIVDRVGA